MRKVTFLAAMILAACGGSSSSPPTYALKDAAATIPASGTCSVTGIGTIAASVAFVGASDYTGACTSMTPPGLQIQASGALAELVVVRVDSTPAATPPPLNVGTYKFYDVASGVLPPADPANPALGFKFFTGPVAKCAAMGGGNAPRLAITGGEVVIDSVSPLHGTLSATIAGGTTIGGTFTAPTCATAFPLDVSALCAGVNAGALTFPPFTCP